MTYRHFNCIYFHVLDGKNATCVKHRKTFVNIYNIGGCQKHCNDLTLTPQCLISHILYAKEREKGNNRITWDVTDKKAEEILKKYASGVSG